ncbi:hypothetical protein EMIT0P12_10193 [Pseudomonas sp. IT-P12]
MIESISCFSSTASAFPANNRLNDNVARRKADGRTGMEISLDQTAHMMRDDTPVCAMPFARNTAGGPSSGMAFGNYTHAMSPERLLCADIVLIESDSTGRVDHAIYLSSRLHCNHATQQPGIGH